MKQRGEKPTKLQAELLRRRGLDPRYYMILRELNYSVFIIDIRDNTIKLLEKRS